MKLAKGFITQDVRGTQMMVAAGPAAKKFNGMVRANETAAFIINCLKKNTTEEKIIKAVLDEYDTTEEIAAEQVRKIIDQLRGIGAIDE